MKTSHDLYNPRFPRANQYNATEIFDNSMGPNALWLTEWLTEDMRIQPNMRVLDLGCGRALSSIFFAKEYQSQVTAADLWIEPHENWTRIQQYGLEKQIFPVHADARLLPFAHTYYDLVCCVDSFIYFGTDDNYLDYILKFIRPQGQLAIVIPGLMRDLPEEGVPDHLQNFWGSDCWSWHTLDWWRHHWARTGQVKIEAASTLENGCQHFLHWKLAQEKVGKNPWPDDVDVLKADEGQYIGFIRLIATKL